MSSLKHLMGVDGQRVTAVRSFNLFTVEIYGHGKVLATHVDKITEEEYYTIGFSDGTSMSSRLAEYVEEYNKFLEWVGNRKVVIVPLTDYEVDTSA